MSKHDDVTSPAPGVLSVAREGAELVVGESVVEVAVVGVVEHGFDALSEQGSSQRGNSLARLETNVFI